MKIYPSALLIEVCIMGVSCWRYNTISGGNVADKYYWK